MHVLDRVKQTVHRARHRIPAMNAVVRSFLNFMPEPDTAPERNPFKLKQEPRMARKNANVIIHEP